MLNNPENQKTKNKQKMLDCAAEPRAEIEAKEKDYWITSLKKTLV